MIGDRLGVISDEVSANFGEALDWIVAEGLRYVEIRMVDGVNVSNLNDGQVTQVAGEVARRGLLVSAVASPLFKCALDPSRPVESGDMFGQAEESVEAHFEKLSRTIDIAAKLGTRRIRIFSFWREAEPKRYEAEIVGHLKKAAAVAERAGALLLLENERSCNGGYAFEVASIVRQVGSPALRALWDPGNETQGQHWSYPGVYREVRDHLAHVHLKDAVADGNGKIRCVPIDSGRVPYLSQIRDLEQDGYKGLYIIETHYVPQGGSKMEGTKLSLEGLRKLLVQHVVHQDQAEQLKVNVCEDQVSLEAAVVLEVASQLKELLSRKEQVRIVFANTPMHGELLSNLRLRQGIDWSRIEALHLEEFGLPDEAANPLDLACLDIGENGRIGFNGHELDRVLSGTRVFCTASRSTKQEAVKATLRGPVSTDCPSSFLRNHPDCTLFADRDSYGLLS